MADIRSFFEKDGSLSAVLDTYEVRQEQISMAEGVEKAVTTGSNLLVEAGTGVGKTLAYLLPLVLWTTGTGKRAAVSTFTKALQNQLCIKDLPLLKKALDIDFKFSICLGSSNYICMRKARKNIGIRFEDDPRRQKQMDYILEWLQSTETGVMTDMEITPDRSVWELFSRDADMCLSRMCRSAESCFFRKARREQAGSDILVLNHALFFTDIVSGSKVLPDLEAVVFDEAHTLEDVATRHFGREASNTGLDKILDDISVRFERLRKVPGSSLISCCDEISEICRRLRKNRVLFKKAEDYCGGVKGPAEIDPETFDDNGLADELVLLSGVLGSVAPSIKDPELAEEIKAYAERCDKFAGNLNFIFEGAKEGYAYWVDIRSTRSGGRVAFNCAPVDVSHNMKDYVYDHLSPVIFTSATLSTGQKDLSFINKRLGTEGAMQMVFDSPFNYRKNVSLYLPEGIPDPVREKEDFHRRVIENIIDIYEIMKGRMFCLFTSYSMLNTTARAIREQDPRIDLLVHGDMPRYVLLDIFKKNPASMLLGTTTFWQGVDVPGEALGCVIITKLPFGVPTDPLNAARIKAIRRVGGNPFGEYQIPQAVIMFKQGFGRLIRTKTDKGIVAVLDPRLRTRHYGRYFLEALPPCRRVYDMSELRGAFSERIT
jgi:ATP-dependent DNA helicase DinG